MSLIELLARYDPVLQRLLERKSKIHYLSPRIQNEIITMLAQKVKRQIVNEIKDADFYSVIMDTTQDISKVDQLSQVYVTIVKDHSETQTDMKINESFLGFLAVHDQSALGLEKEIVMLLETEGISINRCRGQGYDGASAMSGAYSGVQKRILAKEPQAIYIHCASHNLNLVLNDACQNVAEVREYYDTIQKLYVFFSGSIKRWELLEGHLSGSSGQRTLKQLCPTRWASRNDAIESTCDFAMWMFYKRSVKSFFSPINLMSAQKL